MNTRILTVMNSHKGNIKALLAAAVLVACALFIREGRAQGDSVSFQCSQVLIEKCGVGNSRPCTSDEQQLILNECKNGQTITFNSSNESPTTSCRASVLQLASMQATYLAAQDAYTKLETNRINTENAILNLKTVVGVGPMSLTISSIALNSGDYFTAGAVIKNSATVSYSIDLLRNNQLVASLLPAKTVSDATRPLSVYESLVLPPSLASGIYQLRITDPANPTLASVLTFQIN